MELFEIKDAHSSAWLRFDGEIPRGLTGYDGCSFVARFSSHSVSATVLVYDIQPEKWSNLFLEMAENWKGWGGEKDCESLEGHLRLEATAGALGHVRLAIRLRGLEVSNSWSAESSIILEAGQLEALSSRARAYFG
jgi:cytochrome c biogenesis factor